MFTYILFWLAQFTKAHSTETYVTTFAGGGLLGTDSTRPAMGFENGVGINAFFSGPFSIAVDISGIVYVSDTANHKIRAIFPNRTVITIAGGSSAGLTLGSIDGIGSSALFYQPRGVAVDSSGIMYVADYKNHKIRAIFPNLTVITLAGGGSGQEFGYVDGIGTLARFKEPWGVGFCTSGRVYIADSGNNKIRAILSNQTVVTLATFNSPRGVSVDTNGVVYVSDNNKISILFQNMSVKILAGGAVAGSVDGFGTNALFSSPSGIGVSKSGIVFVADSGNNKIRAIYPNQTVITVAGGGTSGTKSGFVGYTGTAALFNFPVGLFLGPAGVVYVAESANEWVRVISCRAGTFAPQSDVLQCTSCALGTYSTQGQSNCSFTFSSCPSGTYADPPGSCVECPAGTYNPFTGGESVNACLACSAGTYNANTGQLSCADSCSEGTYGSSPGAISASTCLTCGPALYSSYSAGVCCPVGTWADPGSTTCTPCPAGFWSSTAGASSPSSCQPCAAGTWSNSAGLASRFLCFSCSAGYYCPLNSTAQIPCLANTFNPFANKGALSDCASCSNGTISSPASTTCTVSCPAGSIINPEQGPICLPCSAGTYSLANAASCSTCPQGSFCPMGVPIPCDAGKYSTSLGSATPDVCISCAFGSFGSSPGATSPSACKICSAGTYNPTSGSTLCFPCPAGSACPFNSSQPTPCPANTYGALLGGTSLGTACQPCDSNAYSAAGSSQCILFPGAAYVCPRNYQPISGTPPLTFENCIPLQCPPPLSISSSGTGCVGCSSGSSAPPLCEACPPNTTCPGFFAQPLTSPASLSTGSPTCIAASSLTPATVIIPNQPASFTLASIPPLVTICTAVVLALFVLSLLAYAAHSPTAARLRLDSLLKRVDTFSLSHTVPPGSPLLNQPTALGGACSLISLLAFLTLALILLFQFTYANVSVQSSLNTLLASNPFSPAVKWASPLASPLTPGIPSGLQLRLFSQAGLACSGLAAGTAISSSPPGWEVSPPTLCGDGRSLFTLTCATCSMTSTSTLSFYLPYTCQSFFMEAVAVDSLGVINSVVFPPSLSVATPTTLVSSLTWTIDVLSTILQDTVSTKTVQGYHLSVSAASAQPTTTGLTILPNQAAVAITVNLPQQTYYSSTLLQPRQSVVELFSSIVGMLGIIGLFRVFFNMSEATLLQVANKRRQSAAPLASGIAQEQQQQEASAGVTNPLRRGAPQPAAPVVEAEPTTAAARSPWKECRDGTDVWYMHEETQERVWELPL